ncbi:hypothetical protein E2C01_026695 [Portunus trituberculatus]|uniref:Uncharacterized protein n=1 Tax=Portunus trituberculatus TaxID=210409 RepID=A0A5B7EJ13_PORTR|nr:hypothetical protein [Portunus trituberculatus]
METEAYSEIHCRDSKTLSPPPPPSPFLSLLSPTAIIATLVSCTTFAFIRGQAAPYPPHVPSPDTLAPAVRGFLENEEKVIKNKGCTVRWVEVEEEESIPPQCRPADRGGETAVTASDEQQPHRN